MSSGQTVYLSTTSADLRSAGDLLARELRAMNYAVVRTDKSGPARDLQRIADTIARCEIFVQLVGCRYGAEPAVGSTEFGRVSHGQFEALTAEKCGRAVIYLLLDPSFPCRPAPLEAPELTQMQQWYREHLASARTVLRVSQPEELKWVLRGSSQPPPRSSYSKPASRRWLANAALVTLSAVALTWAGLHVWKRSSSSSGSHTSSSTQAPVQEPKLILVAGPPAPEASSSGHNNTSNSNQAPAEKPKLILFADSPEPEAKEETRADPWDKQRVLLEMVASESVTPDMEGFFNPDHKPIREAVNRVWGQRPDLRATVERSIEDFTRHVIHLNSPSAYDRALVHLLAGEFDRAAALSLEAAHQLVSERMNGATRRTAERKAWQLAGHAHSHLRQWDQAIECYSNAESLDDPQMNDADRMRLWTRQGLSKAFNQDFEGAVPHFRDLAQFLEKKLPAGDPGIPEAINVLAKALGQARHYGEAATQSRRALELAERARGVKPRLIAECTEQLAEACLGLHHFEEAEALLNRARKIWEEGPEVCTDSLAANLRTTGDLLTKLNRPAEAEPVLRRALSLTEGSLGKSHPLVGRTLNSLGLVLPKNARHDEAKVHLRRAVEIMERFYGPEHPDFALTLNNLAVVLAYSGEFHEARTLNNRALTIMKKYAAARGIEHPQSHIVAGVAKMVQQAVDAVSELVTPAALQPNESPTW